MTTCHEHWGLLSTLQWEVRNTTHARMSTTGRCCAMSGAQESADVEPFKQPDLTPDRIDAPGAGWIRLGIRRTVVQQVLDGLAPQAPHQAKVRLQPGLAGPGRDAAGGALGPAHLARGT